MHTTQILTRRSTCAADRKLLAEQAAYAWAVKGIRALGDGDLREHRGAFMCMLGDEVSVSTARGPKAEGRVASMLKVEASFDGIGEIGVFTAV